MTNIRLSHRISNRMPVRSIKIKKTAETAETEDIAAVEVVPSVKTASKTDPFNSLMRIVLELQSEFEKLQKEITRTKEAWVIEQKAYQKEVIDRNTQEELERKRNQETYVYETARKQKQAEDEFADKKAAWEKNLKEQQDALAEEKTELVELRRLVAGFDSEKEKAVSEAKTVLQKELIAGFDVERKLAGQEQKAEKDLLNLKITNLTVENNRLNTEILALRKALEEATRQVKEIAVKVIESGTKSPSSDLVAS